MVVIEKKERLRKRCENLIKHIRKKYPVLRDTKIHLHVWRQPIGSMMAERLFGYHIFVDYRKYKYASNTVLIGGLAHELAHLEYFKTRAFLKNLFDTMRYICSRKFKRRVEIKTDKTTIEKGYGKELAVNTEFRLKTASERDINYKKRFYMMPDEIKSYAKKIGKW